MTSSSGDRQVKIVVAADVAAAIRGLTDLSNATGNVGRSGETATSAWDKLKESIAGQVALGSLIEKGVSGAFGMIVDGAKAVVTQGMAFEDSLNSLRAVTGASADEMIRLSSTARQLGNDVTIPGASASDAASAMLELAKGGLTAREAMEASRGTMILAAAAQIEGAEAAEIQANALNTFGLKADQAGRVANVLANVANKSSGEITDFSQGLAQAGTVASSFGWSIEETTTMLGLMANAGIKGSDAGTSLKTTMTAMLKPTADQSAALEELGIKTKDSSGHMISARDLTAELAAAKGRMTDAEFNTAAATAFGTDAVRTALVAAQQATTGYDDMNTALTNTTGAQDVAAANTAGLSGSLDKFNNALSDVALTLYQELQPALKGVVDFGATAFTWLGDAIGWFTDLPAPLITATLTLGGLIALSGPMAGLWASMKASGVGLAIQGEMLAAKLALQSIRIEAALSGTSMGGFSAAMRLAGLTARSLALSLKAVFLSNPIGLAIIGVTTALSFFATSSDDAAASTDGLTAAIDEQTGALQGNAAEIIASEAANSGASAAYERLGGNVSDYVDALAGVPGAQDKVNAKIAEGRAAYDAQQKAVQGATQGTGNFGVAMGSAAGAAGAAVPSIQDLNSATDYLSTAQGTLAGQTEEVRLKNAGLAGDLGATEKATAGAGDAAETAADQATPFGDALKDIRSAASEADAATQFLSITLLELAGNSVPAEQRARANAAAFRDVGQATRDIGDANDTVAEKQRKFDELAAHLGGTLDGQAESATNATITQEDLDAAGRDLADAQAGVQDATDKQKDALDKAADSARAMTAEAFNNNVQQLGMKGAIDKAIETMQAQREQFIGSAVDAGIERGAAEELANQQGLIPDNVRTTYESVGVEDAIQRVKDLNAGLDAINDRTVRYSVVGGEVSVEGAIPVRPGSLAVRKDGGIVNGPGSGTSDSIPALISNGEFVVKAAQTAKHLPLLHAINSGAPGFADGGLVGATIRGDFQSADFGASLQSSMQEYTKKIKESLFFGAAGVRNAFLQAILSKQGTSYVWGAAGPDVFDCSGLMSWGLTQAGVGKGRLTAEGFNSGFPATSSPQPGDMVTFDTGRLPGRAGHIGAVLNPAAQTMMHTDGAGPARVQGYANRGGFLKFVNVIGNSAPAGASGGPNGAAGDMAASAGGGVEQWRDEVIFALNFMHESTSLANTILNQIRTESSGNASAINNWDSNARRGTPSKGLVQVIDPTFRSYAMAPYNQNIWDPISNIIAGANYARNQYGSIAAGMRGVAYDSGGPLVPGYTLAYNGTGRTEYIRTAEQEAAAQSALNFAAGMGGQYYSGGQQGGVHIDTLVAMQPGQATAELDYALARCR